MKLERIYYAILGVIAGAAIGVFFLKGEKEIPLFAKSLPIREINAPGLEAVSKVKTHLKEVKRQEEEARLAQETKAKEDLIRLQHELEMEKLAEERLTPSENQALVFDPPTNTRACPSMRCSVLTVVETRRLVDIYDVNYTREWYRTNLGWIHYTQLKF